MEKCICEKCKSVVGLQDKYCASCGAPFILDSAVFSMRGRVYNERLREFQRETFWVLKNPTPQERPVVAQGVRALYIDGDVWMLSKDAEITHGEIYDTLVDRRLIQRKTPYATAFYFAPNRLEVDADEGDLDLTNLDGYTVKYL